VRIALGLEYDGSAFKGWQIQQAGVRTVQSCLERALSKVADHPVSVICAGRTDAGVHASGQVVHFDSPARRSDYAWLMGGNTNLPDDISITWAQVVPEDFHARFSALARRYRYTILNRPCRSALHRQRATWHYKPLDAERMQAAAACLRGEHDFTSFRAVGCQSHSPYRHVFDLTVERHGEFVVIDIEANAFLHHMVRNVAGVLMAIGSGDRPAEWTQELLAVRDRTQAGVTAPPDGLYLLAVRYGDVFGLPYPALAK